MFIVLFVQSRLYQQNLEAFFESSIEEGLEEIVNRLQLTFWFEFMKTEMEFWHSISNCSGSLNLKVIIVLPQNEGGRRRSESSCT